MFCKQTRCIHRLENIFLSDLKILLHPLSSNCLELAPGFFFVLIIIDFVNFKYVSNKYIISQYNSARLAALIER